MKPMHVSRVEKKRAKTSSKLVTKKLDVYLERTERAKFHTEERAAFPIKNKK